MKTTPTTIIKVKELGQMDFLFINLLKKIKINFLIYILISYQANT